MDVTRSNFAEVFQDLKRVVNDSSFLAIDGEFTGLVIGPDVKAFDTLSQYYSKLRDGSMKFLFVQFGLSAFKYNSAEEKWTNNSYNFYIFPRPYNRFIEDPRFSCQSSSIDFLASHGFDFNKLFRDGIPYLTQAEVDRQSKFLKERHSKAQNSQNGGTPARLPTVPVPDEHQAFINRTETLIDEFLQSDKNELQLERSGAFLRKLLYQLVEEKYVGVARMETRSTSDGGRVLFVTREGTEQERKERELEKQQKELQELDEAFGFSKVIKMIRTSGKLLIGHNMLLDICHMLNRFCGPLPYDFSDFKEMASTAFPKVLDTKYLATDAALSEHVQSSILNDLHKKLSGAPFEMPVVETEVEGRGYTSADSKYHDAGYDAYVTGMCFITMVKHLDKKSLHPDVCSCPLLVPYFNKIMVTRLQDIYYINLKGNDPAPPRDHVFHISVPRDWRSNDISKLFSPYGNVFICWLDDSSAYVALSNREKAGSVLKSLQSTSKYRIVPYLKYQQSLGGACIPSSPTTVQNRRRSQEKLQEADSPLEQGNKRKRKSAGPAKESKFSRRSIDTIVEEEDCLNPADEISTTVTSQQQFDESDNWE